MKEIIVILILFAPTLSNGQVSTKDESKLSVGVNFSPNYCYRTLNYSIESQTWVDLREEWEQAYFGFNTGLSTHYTILERLELELDVQFSRQTLFFKDIPITKSKGTSLIGFEDKEIRYNYLEIPLRVNCLVLNKQLFSYITGGASANIFIVNKNKSWLSYIDGTSDVVIESKNQDFNKIVVALVGGIGLGYRVSEKVNFRLEPIFRYSLTPISESNIKQHNYSGGCQFGMNLQL